MKKGTIIKRIVISNDGKITAYAAVRNGEEFVLPLTRSQRNVFSRWGKKDFFDAVRSEFGIDSIIDENTFKMEKN
jgi:hypothetical protein